MYSSLQIHGFRGLESLSLNGLGRINLLVGKNNCGKTSILECVELVRSAGNPQVVQSILSRRGQRALGDDRRRSALEARHLFPGRDLEREIVVRATTDGRSRANGWNCKVTLAKDPFDALVLQPGLSDDDDGQWADDVVLRVDWSDVEEPHRMRMTSDGLLTWPRIARVRGNATHDALFVRAEGMGVEDIVSLFDNVVLTDREQAVTQAMRVVEPHIERIASVAYDRSPFLQQAPGGVYVKLRGERDRVPISSTGDGMWRMLGLALGLANAQGGVLLIDEIDTGLHYSAMEDMWMMMSERANALSVQVFATTHSRDCVESLAAIASSSCAHAGEVTIQRIEPGREQAVRFGNDEIVAAAGRGLEVR